MQRSRARPDPVSCQSCRSKKLKCSRVQPCSNCTARGITCHFLARPQGQTDASLTSQGNAELLRRIEKLESIVLKQTGSVVTRSSNISNPSPLVRQELLIADSKELSGSEGVQNGDQDSRWLENVGMREDALLPRLSKGLGLRVISRHEMLKPNSGWDSQFGATAISLPTYSIAVQLLQNYESNVRPLCHILHMPTVRSQMRTFYLGIAQGDSILHGQAALLLSLFALSAYFYQPSDTSELATTKQEAIQLSKILSGNALDVLDHSRRNTSGTLEDIQAYIHMAFVSYHLDGFSARGRMLTTTAIGIARELRLHQLDADPPNDETNIRCLIDREIQRRVFWHVALTDWIFATISGPQEGTYSIHINHIAVRLPKDCADDDLLLGTDNEITESQPTGMSFFLSRLRLAHLSREMADKIPLSTSALMEMPYSQIVALDQKLQDLISSLPYFYRLDQESRRLTKPLETIYPKLSTQRYVLTTEHHSRRWKLHQRFLVRRSISPQHTYSRNACLESARAVIQGYADLKNFENSKGMAPELMGMVVHYTHLALVVMVMDLCFNRDEADEVQIKGEVKRALQMFEDGKEISPLLGRFLGSLKDVLGKHKVQLIDLPMVSVEHAVNAGAGMVLDGLNTNSMLDLLGMQDSDFVFDASLDEFWQAAMQGETNSDQLAWDNLFSELDGQPIC